MDHQSRRRFLATAGVGVTGAFAGCGSNDESAPAGQTDTEDRVTVTFGIEPDAEAFQERQQELVDEVEAGNITQSEATEQLSELESEILAEAATAAQERLESDGADIEAVDEAAGVLRATADPAALVGALTDDRIAAMLEAAAYDSLAESEADGEGAENGTETGE